MHLLLSNDDGIRATGLEVLTGVARELSESVSVVAPDRERSAQSHALTMHAPLVSRTVGERSWSVNGTPADCVYVALHHLVDGAPDLVLSGINHGSNLGNDVFYSGTVAAAMEACLHGYPAIAFSLHREAGDRSPILWETARVVARQVIERAMRSGLPRRVMLNVNIPNVPVESLRGIATCRLGERYYAPEVDVRRNPRGREYYWIGGSPQGFCDGEGTDGARIRAGWATVTPLRADLTCYATLEAFGDWTAS